MTSRARILAATTDLLGRQGYAATGMKQIVANASAPYGSIYHFFPGGKEELATEAIEASAGLYLALIDHHFADRADLAQATHEFFDQAAVAILELDYVDPCPVATVAMEVASTSEPLRAACAAAFASWVERAAGHFVSAGLAPEPSQRLAVALLCALQGGFMLARTFRDPEPLRAVGEQMVAAVHAQVRGSEETR